MCHTDSFWISRFDFWKNVVTHEETLFQFIMVTASVIWRNYVSHKGHMYHLKEFLRTNIWEN